MRIQPAFFLAASLLSMAACKAQVNGGAAAGGGGQGGSVERIELPSTGTGSSPADGGAPGTGTTGTMEESCLYPYLCPSSAGGVSVPVPPSIAVSGGKAEITTLPEVECNATTRTVTPITHFEVLAPGTSMLNVTLDDHSAVAVTFFDHDGALVDGGIWSPASALAPAVATSNVRHVPSQYPTIQSAVDASSPGDTVRVAPGTFTEAIVLSPGVRLLGSGADQTTLDAQGQSIVLVSASWGSSVRGFRFVNVGPSQTCADPDDPFVCAASHYPAAIAVAGGHDPFCDMKGTALVADNVFENDHFAVMYGFRAYGIVRNNVFRSNHVAFAAVTGADEQVVIRENVFYGNDLAIAGDASHLHIDHDVLANNGIGYQREHVQAGQVRCNAFFGNGLDSIETPIDMPAITVGADGNTSFEGAVNLAPALAEGCFEPGKDPASIGWGSFAGAFGEAFEAGLD